MRIFKYFFGKSAAKNPNEESLLISSLVVNESEEVLSSDKEKNLGLQNDHVRSLLTPELARVIGCHLGCDDFENAQGLRSLAVQHTDYADIMALDTNALSKSLKDFEKRKKSVEAVITYLLKHHSDCLRQDINFRYVNLNKLTLSNPVPDGEGLYTVDITGADYAALKQTFQDKIHVNSGIVFSALMVLLFLFLFFFMERNLLFCSIDILTEWKEVGPGTWMGFAPAQVQCGMHSTLAPGGAWGCGEFSPVPDICSEEHVYCPTGSFLNSAWGYMASVLDPFGRQGTAVSCSYTNQVVFIIGACIFSLMAASFAVGSFRTASRFTPVPDVLRENWKNVQKFFKNPKANFSVPPIKINPRADVDRIAVISS